VDLKEVWFVDLNKLAPDRVVWWWWSLGNTMLNLAAGTGGELHDQLLLLPHEFIRLIIRVLREKYLVGKLGH
jgi:hypothetical protein